MSAPYYSNVQDYLRNAQHHLNMDSRRSSQWTVDDDESSILDDNILETSVDSKALDLSSMDQRRTSFVDTAVFSPVQAAHEWDFGTDSMSGVEREFDSGAFVKMDPQSQFDIPNWPANDRSGSCTPVPQNFQGVDFDAINFSAFATPTFEAAAPHVSITPVSIFQGQQTSSVPDQVKDWSPSEHTEAHTLPSNGNGVANVSNKNKRPGSPGPRPSSPLQMRRDGIRKKNARFEIPPERTLMNIDSLIASTTEESEIRLLKQQKRLLRNRQAALDSRQRKKQHTERLEEEKKIHSQIINELEERNNSLEIRDRDWLKKEQEWMSEREMMQHYLQTNQMQSEEMVRNHTLETAELRKKNAYLVQELEKLQEKMDRVSLNSAPTPTANFSDEFTFDGMPTDPFWEPPSFEDQFTNIPRDEPTPEIKKEHPKMPSVKEDEKPAAPGLLFLLLLFGAFVASKASTNSALPPIPQPLRSASAVVLNTIFEDAGVKTAGANAPQPSSVQAATGASVSQRVSESWVVAKSSSSEMIGLNSALGVLNSRLDQPSREQEEQQLKMLTAAEYQEVTSKNFLREPENTTSEGRRHLQQGLAALRNGNKPTAAEVYTRSLLWDKVDAEVVRRFAAFAQQAAASESSMGNKGPGYNIEVV